MDTFLGLVSMQSARSWLQKLPWCPHFHWLGQCACDLKLFSSPIISFDFHQILFFDIMHLPRFLSLFSPCSIHAIPLVLILTKNRFFWSLHDLQSPNTNSFSLFPALSFRFSSSSVVGVVELAFSLVRLVVVWFLEVNFCWVCFSSTNFS